MRSIFLAGLVLVGCATNPADNKPKATVSNSTSTPTVASTTAPPASPGAPGTAAPRTLAGSRYVFDGSESEVEFQGSKVTGSHKGGFKQFSGQIGLVDNDPTRSSVELEIDMNSVFSDDEKLTGHLKSKDFFEVEAHPTATFKSTKIAKDGDKYTLTGDLTLHGVTKQISFPAKIETSPTKVEAEAEFSINRNDFGIVYKGKADNLIRPEVVIELDLEAKAAD